MKRFMRKFRRQFRYGEKGFTLIELLVVVAILGILAAIVIPNVAKFIGEGEQEAKDTEYHNLQTSVLALMADCKTGTLDGSSDYTGVDLLSEVEGVEATNTTVTPNVTHSLDEYIIGGQYPLKQAYDIALNGSVTLSGS